MDTTQASHTVVKPSRAIAALWWLVVGALVGMGLVSILTIGLLLLVVAALLAAVAIWWAPLRSVSAWLVVAGLAAGPLTVSWLNRDGPGTVCHTAAGQTSCVDQWSPWPFAVAGLILVIVGIALVRVAQRRTTR